MIEMTPYKPGHLDLFIRRFSGDKKYTESALDSLCQNPKAFCFTLLDDLSPIGVIGITQTWPKVGECWTVLSDDIKNKPIAFHKRVLSIINSAYETLGLVRIQMMVRCDIPQAVKWAESLGFKRESKMLCTGQDCTDYYMYVRFS